MRRRHAFSPQVWDSLEDRVVPSLATLVPPILLGQTVALPPQVQNSSQVHAAFEAFAELHLRAVQDVLLAPDRAGVIDPPRTRPASTQAVEQALETLANYVVASLGDQSPDSSLSTQVVNAILSDSPDSLEKPAHGDVDRGHRGRGFPGRSTLATDATQTTVQQAATRVATLIDAPVGTALPRGWPRRFRGRQPVQSPGGTSAAIIVAGPVPDS